MRLAELVAPRTFRIVDVPVPEPDHDQLLVRVAACGVCGSDLDPWSGRVQATFPARLGHEVSGVVESVGADVTGFRPGDPVAVWATGSGFADYVAVAAEHARLVRSVPLDQAMAEPIACAVNAVEAARIRPGDDVLIIGAGFMGQLMQQLVRLSGAGRVIVADLRADALRVAEDLGADVTIDLRQTDLIVAAQGLTEGRGFDVTFEVTGSQQPLLIMGEITRMSGTLVLAGFHQGEPRRVPLAHWNWMAFTLVNAHFREPSVIMDGLTRGLRMLESGRLHLDALITHRFGLDDIGAAFEAAATKPDGFVKSVITTG